jgi:hypothetical protein
MNAKLESLKCRISDSMRANPVKWIGIAAGTGFGIGVAGRLLQNARERRHEIPELLIVDASC